MSNTKAFKPDDAHAQIRALEARISKLERSQRSGHASIVSASVANDDLIPASFGNLAHVGPVVTFPVDASGTALVIVGAQIGGSAAVNVFVSFDIVDSNGTTVHFANDVDALVTIGGYTVAQMQAVHVTGLTPGLVHTATMKYQADTANTTTASLRSLIVIP